MLMNVGLVSLLGNVKVTPRERGYNEMMNVAVSLRAIPPDDLFKWQLMQNKVNSKCPNDKND